MNEGKQGATSEALKWQIMLYELRLESAVTELGMAREHGCSQGTTVTRLDPEKAREILALRRRIEIRGALQSVQHVEPGSLERLRSIQAEKDTVASADDECTLIILDLAFHLTIFRLAGLDALEQILTRCTLHSHRSKLWAPSYAAPRRAIAGGSPCSRPAMAKACHMRIGGHIDTIAPRDGAA